MCGGWLRSPSAIGAVADVGVKIAKQILHCKGYGAGFAELIWYAVAVFKCTTTEIRVTVIPSAKGKIEATKLIVFLS